MRKQKNYDSDYAPLEEDSNDDFILEYEVNATPTVKELEEELRRENHHKKPEPKEKPKIRKIRSKEAKYYNYRPKKIKKVKKREPFWFEVKISSFFGRIRRRNHSFKQNYKSGMLVIHRHTQMNSLFKRLFPRHYHRIHHRSFKVRQKVWKKLLLSSIICVLSIIAVLFISVVVMYFSGKASLYSPNKIGPMLGRAEFADAKQADAKIKDWKSDYVRYNGKVYDYNEKILSFLIMGIDHDGEVTDYKDALDGGQADALFLLCLDPVKNKISVIAVNRNTMTDVDIYNEKDEYQGTGKFQICLAHGYGDGKQESCLREVRAVSNLFYNLPINGYAAINYDAIPKINDAVGGVKVTVLEDVKVMAELRSGSNKLEEVLQKGDEVTLDGIQAFWYTKGRGDYIGAADKRLEREKQYLTSFIPTLRTEVSKNPVAIMDLYSDISPYMVTDISVSKLTYLIQEASAYNFSEASFYTMEGVTMLGNTGHEEFIYDEKALYDMIIEIFYNEIG